MKLIIKFLFPICLLTAYNLFGQISNTQNKFDSSFTLAKHLRQDKLDIGEHGVFFNESSKQVLKDFNYFGALSLIDLTNYQRQVIYDNNHFIKIWTSKKSSENISKILEINSIYLIDTFEDNEQRFKDTIFYNDYFIQLKDTAKNVWYETIKRQGVNKYSIGDKQVWASRETILVGLFYIDHKKEIKSLLTKYNYAQLEVITNPL